MFPGECDFVMDIALSTDYKLWQRNSENQGIKVVLLTDLSQALGCIDLALSTAKLFAFGISPLKLIYSYLSNQTNEYQKIMAH